MKRQTNIINDIDWFTVGLFLILAIMGWFNIYAAVYDEHHSSIFDLSQRYGKQLLWIVTSLAIAVVICIIDVHFYASFSYIIHAAGVMALMAVLVLAPIIKGTKGWFVIGDIQIQPAEFVKITVSLALAKYLGNLNGRLMDVRNFAWVIGIIFLPVSLILLQPDVGSALIFLAFFLALYREGLPTEIILFGMLAVLLFIVSILMQDAEIILKLGLITLGFVIFWFKTQRGVDFLKGVGLFSGITLLLWLVNFLTIKRFELNDVILGSAVLATIIFVIMSFVARLPIMRTISLFIIGALLFTFSVDFVFDNALNPHHQQRILVMLGIEDDPFGIGYNVNQSKIAIGSGGMFGKGFLQGTQTKHNFVPEQSTDFIFCTVGEEWGFVGVLVVIGLFVTLLLRMLFIAERQRSVYSRVYCYCVLCVFFVHVTINIGMTVGLLPVIGIPLPFFSYGGSSLWAFTVMLFIMLRIDASRGEYIR